MYITDLTHFLDKSGAIGPVKGPARAMAQFHVDVVAHASDATSKAFPAPRCFKCKKGRSRLSRPRTAPWCGSARCAAPRGAFRTGKAASGICATARRPSADRKSEADGLSSRLFLLSADDTLHALASTAFMRMLRREDVARVPDFAGQRVRQASVVVEVVDGTPSRMVHWTFSILDIDADGLLDVERLTTQQFARVDDPFEPARPVQG